jgi:hypothetical protein
MPSVVTAAATIKCSHQGTVQVTATQQKLTVDGQPALVDGDLVGSPILGCKQPVTPAGGKPCMTTTSMILGAALKLKAGGKGVLLENANGLTDGVPPGTWSVESAGQTKLTAS